MRRDARLCAMMCATAVVLVSAGKAAATARIRPVSEMHGNLVQLSDLFSGLEGGQDCALGPGPGPGSRLVIGGAQLQAIADQFGVALNAPVGSTNVVLERPGTPLLEADIVHALEVSLTPLGLPATAVIRLSDWHGPVVDPGSKFEISSPSFSIRRPDNLSADIVISYAGLETAHDHVSGSAANTGHGARGGPKHSARRYRSGLRRLPKSGVLTTRFPPPLTSNGRDVIGLEATRPARQGRALIEERRVAPTRCGQARSNGHALRPFGERHRAHGRGDHPWDRGARRRSGFRGPQSDIRRDPFWHDLRTRRSRDRSCDRTRSVASAATQLSLASVGPDTRARSRAVPAERVRSLAVRRLVVLFLRVPRSPDAALSRRLSNIGPPATDDRDPPIRHAPRAIGPLTEPMPQPEPPPTDAAGLWRQGKSRVLQGPAGRERRRHPDDPGQHHRCGGCRERDETRRGAATRASACPTCSDWRSKVKLLSSASPLVSTTSTNGKYFDGRSSSGTRP